MSNYLARGVYGRALGALQTVKRSDKDQVESSAGGYVYAIDPWSRVDRFLILGTEGETYFAAEHTLTQENATNLAPNDAGMLDVVGFDTATPNLIADFVRG